MVKSQRARGSFYFNLIHFIFYSCSKSFSANLIPKTHFLLVVCVSLCNLAAALLRFLLFTPTDVTQQDSCGREEAPGPATGIWDGGAIVWYNSALHTFSCSVKIVL